MKVNEAPEKIWIDNLDEGFWFDSPLGNKSIEYVRKDAFIEKLLDEATGALDIKMKREVQNILLKILNNSEKTILNVTHSVEGAVYLSTKIVILLPKPCIIYKTMDIRFDGEPPRDKWIFSINQFIEYSKELTEYLEKVCSM